MAVPRGRRRQRNLDESTLFASMVKCKFALFPKFNLLNSKAGRARRDRSAGFDGRFRIGNRVGLVGRAGKRGGILTGWKCCRRLWRRSRPGFLLDGGRAGISVGRTCENQGSLASLREAADAGYGGDSIVPIRFCGESV